MKTRRAFTIVELMISVAVMLITYAAMAVSAQSAKQSAEHEAERLAAYIFRTIQRADRMHRDFTMDTCSNTDAIGKYYYVEVQWDSVKNVEIGGNTERSFRASRGCTYSDNFPGSGEIAYNANTKRFKMVDSSAMSGGTITVTDSQGEVYYVIIALNEGRIRLSAKEP